MTNPLAALSDTGVVIWLDDLSRRRLTSGSLAGLAGRDHVVGVTTNPSIFARAITGIDAYDGQIQDLAQRGVALGEALRALTTFDANGRMSGRRCRRTTCSARPNGRRSTSIRGSGTPSTTSTCASA